MSRRLDLQAKEGLALLNGTQATWRQGSSAGAGPGNCSIMADLAGAMSLEALKGSPVAFDARIHQARPHRGTSPRCGTLIAVPARKRDSRVAPRLRPVQDAYSLRCMPQVHGPVRECLEYVRGVAAVEINSATDNPLVFADRRRDSFRRQLSRAVSRTRVRLPGNLAFSTGKYFRAPHRTTAQSGIWRPAAVPCGQSRTELRFHDRAGCGCSSLERKQSAVASSVRRFHSDIRQQRRPRARWRWELR